LSNVLRGEHTMLCHNFFLEDIAQVLGEYWGKSSTVSWEDINQIAS